MLTLEHLETSKRQARKNARGRGILLAMRPFLAEGAERPEAIKAAMVALTAAGRVRQAMCASRGLRY